MTAFVIERDVPIPERRWPAGGDRRSPMAQSAYPFARMEPGDSFYFPYEEYSRVTRALSTYRQGHRGIYVVRRIEGGARCWRVS